MLTLLTVAGCHKVAPGITGTLTGLVSDTTTSIPVANAQISVREYYLGTYGPIPGKIVGKALTGPDGRYRLNFTTTGNGVKYVENCTVDSTYANFNDGTTVTAGKDAVVNFGVIKLLPVLARIIVTNDPYPPLTAYLGYQDYATIYGTNNDTTVTLLVFPRGYQQIRFSIQNPAYPLNVTSFQDISYSTSIQTFNVDPSTFK